MAEKTEVVFWGLVHQTKINNNYWMNCVAVLQDNWFVSPRLHELWHAPFAFVCQ